ncbi:ABC transporter substrate-binding protein [Mixta theicola]|uniref:ABC transporter substrate-binding protein n=1 Tax=Mixta theicola TaxID=1458355 RepID=A0A2K1QCF2_9GAMM|nr:ABC transporter substrate-binding protein [Mixta theicola]PNS12697.1 ABC transporter substrate-binding protein [Mixta theicola]
MKLSLPSALLACLLLPSLLFAAPEHNDIRVATPWPAQNTIIAMLGYGQNIVGTSAVAKRIPLFRQFYPAIEQVPVIGVTSSHEINPEQVIALRTQLLFLPENMSIAQPGVLQQAGVKVLALRANSMQALVDRVMISGQALGPDAVQVAQRYQRYFQHNVALVQDRLKDLPESQRLKVYHSMGSALTTTGRPSLNQDWMDLAGARNVAADWFSQEKNSAGEVPLEKVAQANPDVIVAMNKRDAEIIRSSAQWQGIAAVQKHRVYVNPKGMFWWCRETSEEALQFLWLAKTLYPQRFQDIDMQQETRRFYHDFFGMTLSDKQIQAILLPE